MQIKSFRVARKKKGRSGSRKHTYIFGGPKGKMCWLYLKCQIPRSNMEGVNMCFNNQVNEQTYEPHYEKTGFCICENKDADQLPGNLKLISAFVFATRIVQSLYFLNTKLQASSYLQ